jgi:membrane protease YdiL (CAAX protease family)
MKHLPALRLAVIVILGSATAWILLRPLPWPARALTTVLLVPLPVLLMLQTRVAQDLPEDTEREALYLSSALSVWILAAVAMLAARASDFDRADLRLVTLPAPTLLAASGITILAGLAIMALGKMLRIQESPIVHFLIPRSSTEKIAFAGLSFSAGIAEELVFRSFLIAALVLASGSLMLAVMVSVAVFAASHAYQGWSGALRVALLGLILTAPFLITGSVYPSIIAHVGLDLIAGLVLADWLRGSSTTG